MEYEIIIRTLTKHGNCYVSEETFNNLSIEKLSKEIGGEIEVKDVYFVDEGKVLKVIKKKDD